jgi:hypothetical protein
MSLFKPFENPGYGPARLVEVDTLTYLLSVISLTVDKGVACLSVVGYIVKRPRVAP